MEHGTLHYLHGSWSGFRNYNPTTPIERTPPLSAIWVCADQLCGFSAGNLHQYPECRIFNLGIEYCFGDKNIVLKTI